MKQTTSLFLLAVLVSHVYSAPQLISFKDGKLGVSFGGYHAGVGIGGLLGGGATGGLYAEAGTPHGQSAIAGLGGAVGQNGGPAGGLYAGATAGNKIKASAGLAGGVTGEQSAGTGYATAQAGDRFATSGLGGESSIEGASGFSISGSSHVQPVVKTVHKKVHTEINLDAANEIKPLPETKTQVEVHSNVEEQAPPVIVKEVSKIWRPPKYYKTRKYSIFNFQDMMGSMFRKPSQRVSVQRLWQAPQRNINQLWKAPPQKLNYDFSKIEIEQKPEIVEKHIIHTHYKPRRQHFRKTAFIGGYIGNNGEIVPPAGEVYKTEPVIQKRIDIGAESEASASQPAYVNGGGHTYVTKQVSYEKNPTFFSDILNIPISALRAVGDLLGNTAANTNISVQKSASVQAESDSVTSKHVPLSSASSESSSTAQISIETPSASNFFGDILAIPINTLGAVNKFLENNVAGRKRVQVIEEGAAEPTRVRLGPLARRRANKQVIVVQEGSDIVPDKME